MLKSFLIKEEKRNKNMIDGYTKELESLARGKIISKNVKGNIYYYLYYRDGKKVISKYIGKNEESIVSVQEQLDRRYQIEEIIKKLKEEEIKIKKMEALL